MPKIIIEVDQNTYLKSAEAEMAISLYEIVEQERAYLGQWLSWVAENQSLEDIQKFLYYASLFNEGGQRLTTMIIYNGQLVGSVSLVRIDKSNKTAELGYWIRQQCQGLGIVSKSVMRFLDYVFRQLGLHRIEIRVVTQNPKSEAIPKRLDFHYEGQLRQALWLNGQCYDMELYSLLYSDWKIINN